MTTALLMLGAGVVGWFLGAIRPSQLWRHRHDGPAVAVEQLTVGGRRSESGDKVFTRIYTRVLRRCVRCGAAYTEEIDGHWELGSLRPSPSEIVSDFLKGVKG